MSLVDTRYVYIARGTVHFTWDVRLERLVREVTESDADVVAGSLRSADGVVRVQFLSQHLCDHFTLNITLQYSQKLMVDLIATNQ